MNQVPPGPKDRICPQHNKRMSEVCHRCPWWTLVRGKHPQTGEDVDQWNCAIALLPILLIENSRQTRSVAAATESFRNEMVDANKRSAEMIRQLGHPAPAPQKLIGG